MLNFVNDPDIAQQVDDFLAGIDEPHDGVQVSIDYNTRLKRGRAWQWICAHHGRSEPFFVPSDYLDTVGESSEEAIAGAVKAHDDCIIDAIRHEVELHHASPFVGHSWLIDGKRSSEILDLAH